MNHDKKPIVPTTAAGNLPKPPAGIVPKMPEGRQAVAPGAAKKCPLVPGPCIGKECAFHCPAGCSIPVIAGLLLEQKTASTRSADALEAIQERLETAANL